MIKKILWFFFHFLEPHLSWAVPSIVRENSHQGCSLVAAVGINCSTAVEYFFSSILKKNQDWIYLQNVLDQINPVKFRKTQMLTNAFAKLQVTWHSAIQPNTVYANNCEPFSTRASRPPMLEFSMNFSIASGRPQTPHSRKSGAMGASVREKRTSGEIFPCKSA